jgi:hypothetical protein
MSYAKVACFDLQNDASSARNHNGLVWKYKPL